MTYIIEMDHFRTKKQLGIIAKSKGIEYEIYLTVIKYIDKYTKHGLSGYTFKTTASDLDKLYKGDRELFLESYYELMSYWKISMIDAEIPANMEFERFPKIGDLCAFIDRKVQTDKYTC